MVQCVYRGVTGFDFKIKIVNKIIFLSLKIVLAFTNSENPDESSRSSLFAKVGVTSIQRVKPIVLHV